MDCMAKNKEAGGDYNVCAKCGYEYLPEDCDSSEPELYCSLFCECECDDYLDSIDFRDEEF